MDSALEWVQGNGGLCTEESYPYVAKDGACPNNSCGKVDMYIKNVVYPTPHSTYALEQAVARQPVCVAVSAYNDVFQFYKSGVITSKSCAEQGVDHGALVVGYGTDDDRGVDYWLLKNEWSTDW